MAGRWGVGGGGPDGTWLGQPGPAQALGRATGHTTTSREPQARKRFNWEPEAGHLRGESGRGH